MRRNDTSSGKGINFISPSSHKMNVAVKENRELRIMEGENKVGAKKY